MKNLIGHIYDTRNLTTNQIKEIEVKIKEMLILDTIEILKPERNGSFYSVTTDDNNIIDFKVDEYNNKVSLIKYNPLDEDGNRDPYGAILSYQHIKCEK